MKSSIGRAVSTNINKVYVSNFLVGMMFWYGIEKLFMQQIGIDAAGVGLATTFFYVFTLAFDIPAGMLTDRWGRKNVMLLSIASKIVCSLLMGMSTSFPPFLAGYFFYALYNVTSNGTVQALVYDTLYEQGRARLYSKVMGRAAALSLAGAGVANIASGFIADYLGYSAAFYLAVVPCALAFIIWTTIKEPSVHKREHKEKIVTEWGRATKVIMSVPLLRSLAVVMSVLAVAELFKGSFGQLYMLRYVPSPQMIGLMWAVFAATWALGNLIAHKFHARINALIIGTVLPLAGMSFIDNWFSLVLFMIQAVAAAALLNQIETRIQHATASAVRASVLSTLSVAGKVISIPSSFVIGWLIHQYNAFAALRVVTAISVLVLIYWLVAVHGMRKANPAIVSATT